MTRYPTPGECREQGRREGSSFFGPRELGTKDRGEESVSLYFEGDLRKFDEAEQETQKEEISCGQRRGTLAVRKLSLNSLFAGRNIN